MNTKTVLGVLGTTTRYAMAVVATGRPRYREPDLARKRAMEDATVPQDDT